MRLLLQSAALAASLSLASAQGTSEAITFGANGVTAFISGTGGWTFRPTTGISVTALGCFTNVITLNGPVSIGLWADNGTLLASNLVTVGSALLNQSFYSLITPIFLAPGALYHIGAYSAFGGITLGAVSPAVGGTALLSPEIALGGYAVGNGGFVFPAEVTGGNGALLLGPNFLFTRQVPEPGAAALVCLGGLALAAWRKSRRN